MAAILSRPQWVNETGLIALRDFQSRLAPITVFSNVWYVMYSFHYNW